MESRDRILAAAARVYAENGFRGATTRRIAEEAGVNEITIFRQFGSKAALIDEVVRATGPRTGARALLPEHPVDPERELTAWCEEHLAGLRACRSFIRKTMGDFEERPDAVRCAGAGAQKAAQELRAYLVRLCRNGLVDWEEDPSADGGYRINPYAAGAMLMGALFGDAMGRDMMPELYPVPEERAPAMYVRLFLRAVGLRTPAAAEPGRPAAPAKRRKAPATRSAIARPAKSQNRHSRPTPPSSSSPPRNGTSR